jgi:predicted MFS family arabinose efflux permease
MAALILKEKHPKPAKLMGQHDPLKLSHILGHPYTLRLLLTLALASVSMYAVVIYSPQYLKETIGAGAALNGLVLATQAVGAAIISAFGAKWLAKTLGTAGATGIGFGLMALSLSTIPLLDQISWILLTAVLFGFGFGIVLPNLYGTLANLAPSALKSTVMAAGIGAGFLGQFLSPILLGPVLGYGGLEGVFYAAALIALVAGVFFVYPKSFEMGKI